MATFDFEEKLYQELLAILPQKIRDDVKSSLSNQPFRYIEFEPEKFCFKVYATLGSEIHSNDNESYMPLNIHHFEK